jgi:hypothetical protein
MFSFRRTAFPLCLHSKHIFILLAYLKNSFTYKLLFSKIVFEKQTQRAQLITVHEHRPRHHVARRLIAATHAFTQTDNSNLLSGNGSIHPGSMIEFTL